MIWAISLALAKRPPVIVGPDPSAVAAEEEAACSADTPEGFQIHSGFATDPDPATAIERARLAARRLALETSCAGKGEARCAVIRRHVEAWKVPYWNPLTHRACAHVGVSRSWLDDDSRDQERLSAGLGALSVRVADAVQDQALWIEPPLWTPAGCHAGDVGAALVAELQTGLASTGVRLADTADDRRAVRLQVTLASAGSDVVMAAALRSVGNQDRRPLEGLRFPADLFDLRDPGSQCRADGELALEQGRRIGPDGRIVAIDVPRRGSFCEGERIVPTVLVDRRSVVRVFSVAQTGEAYLVWPPPGQPGLVDGPTTLGPMTLVPTASGGDEKLVAVAVAPGAPLGPMDGWSGFCRVPTLTGALYPPGAAGGAVTFQVLPFGADGCDVGGAGGSEVPPIPVVRLCGSP